jgi:PadR family transcriptional regulator PadR
MNLMLNEWTEVRTLNEKYERQMKKGVLDMLVLKLLEDEKKYGYQMIIELNEKSGGRFALKEGTLYPVLYRLEEDGLVESQWSEAQEKKVPRKYYVITDKGKREFRQIKTLWQDICKSVAEVMEEKSDE